MLELRKKGEKHWLFIDNEIGEFTPSKFTINRLNNVITIVYFNNLKSKDYNVSDCYIFDIGDVTGFNTSGGVAFMDKLEELNCPCFQKDETIIVGGSVESVNGQTGIVVLDFADIATPENLGEFIDGLDSKTDIKDVDEFILSDSEDSLKSKKTRFLDLKTKLKSYFDTFYLSLSVFNDFVEDVFDSLDNKLDKSSTPSSVYATDAEGLQVMKPISEFQPVGDYVTVNTTQTVTGNKTFNDVGLIKKNQTYLFPDQSGGDFYIGGTSGYDSFDFNSFDGTDGDGFGSTQIYSNPEEGNVISHTSIDGQVGSTLKINQYDAYFRNKYAGNITSLYVDGQNGKIKIEGTQNKFATLGTSLITGTKNFEFPNNSGTLALLSDLTDTQNALNLKLSIESPSTTGTVISFSTDKVYGTLATPETGNITADVTNAKLGVTNIIIHNSATIPTFGSQFKKLSGSGNYVTGVVNYIYCTFISATEIIYSINQRT